MTTTDPKAPHAGGDVLRLERARRTYRRGEAPVAALDGIDLVVRPGEWVAIVGPSGCGKSTLLNIASGVDRPDPPPTGGRAILCGVDLAAATERELVHLRRTAVGVVFQAFHLVPNLTALENVELPLALAGERGDPGRARELLERVGLGARLNHHPGELSGGEEQRVAVARALVHRPRLVVADEPTGNLDSASGALVLDVLDELRRTEGAALLMATHDDAVAARADRTVRIVDGRIVDGRTSADAEPTHRRSAR
ncbi:putative ABC transporter ATP-binding protein [Planctomycetes bacterium Pla163]|uniref:Putative ABC transporter ATP-binding protein n=1 Tax=Rohdeia mirabilis TaxID=2528008 RepID=A0A518CVP7_9BACT|nr:putative ABC transporter ATP-binding protein [Planctomycetes bacterium Pla163]